MELIFQFHTSAQRKISILFQCANFPPTVPAPGSLTEHTSQQTSPTPPQWRAVNRFTNLHQSRCRSSVRALFKHKHLSLLTMDSKIRQPFKLPSFSLTSVLSSVPALQPNPANATISSGRFLIIFFSCYSTSLTPAVWKQFGDAAKWVCCVLYSMQKARHENKAWWPKSSHRFFREQLRSIGMEANTLRKFKKPWFCGWQLVEK